MLNTRSSHTLRYTRHNWEFSESERMRGDGGWEREGERERARQTKNYFTFKLFIVTNYLWNGHVNRSHRVYQRIELAIQPKRKSAWFAMTGHQIMVFFLFGCSCCCCCCWETSTCCNIRPATKKRENNTRQDRKSLRVSTENERKKERKRERGRVKERHSKRERSHAN